MTEAQFFEALGRKQFEVDRLRQEYARLLGVLGGVCQGDIPADQVRIDLAAQQWRVLAAAEAAQERRAAEAARMARATDAAEQAEGEVRK